MASETKVDVRRCVRCGKNHDQLLFKPLSTPILSGPFETLTHWSMCPELDQPILMGHRDLSTYHDSRIER